MAKRQVIPRIPLAETDAEIDERLADQAAADREDWAQESEPAPAEPEAEPRTPGHGRGHYTPEARTDVQMLSEAAEDWVIEKGGRSQPGSLENFRDRVGLFIYFCELPIHGPKRNEAVNADVQALSTDMVAAFVHWLQSDLDKKDWAQRPHHHRAYAKSTVESYVKALITLERYLVPAFPRRGAPEPIKPYRELHEVAFMHPAADERGRLPYTDRERDELIEAASRGATGWSWRMVVVLLLGTGVRESELCALNLSSPVPDQGYIQLAASMTKGRVRSRKVTLWEDVDSEIRRYLRFRKGPKRPDSPLVTTREGRRYSPEGIKGIFQTLAVRCPDIAGVMPHRCRNTFAVACLRLGMSESQLANELGHRDIRMAHTYAKHVGPGANEGTTPLDVRSVRARAGRTPYFETREANEEEREKHVRKLEGLTPLGRKGAKPTR